MTLDIPFEVLYFAGSVGAVAALVAMCAVYTWSLEKLRGYWLRWHRQELIPGETATMCMIAWVTTPLWLLVYGIGWILSYPIHGGNHE